MVVRFGPLGLVKCGRRRLDPEQMEGGLEKTDRIADHRDFNPQKAGDLGQQATKRVANENSRRSAIIKHLSVIRSILTQIFIAIDLVLFLKEGRGPLAIEQYRIINDQVYGDGTCFVEKHGQASGKKNQAAGGNYCSD